MSLAAHVHGAVLRSRAMDASGVDVVLPQPDPRKNVRWHVQPRARAAGATLPH